MKMSRFCALAGATAMLVASAAAHASAAPPPTPSVKKNPVMVVTYDNNSTTPSVGRTPGHLVCTTGKWKDAPATQEYRIEVLRNSNNNAVVASRTVTGATPNAFSTSAQSANTLFYDIKEGAGNADDGATLKCRVTLVNYPNQRGFTDAVRVAPVAAPTDNTPAPAPEPGAPSKTDATPVTTTGLSNETSGAQTSWQLRCNEGSWNATPAGDPAKNRWNYSWTKNGSPIENETGKIYQVRAGDAGSDIACNVSQTRNGYTSGAVQSSNQMRIAGTAPSNGGGNPSGPSVSGANPSITKAGNAVDTAANGDELRCQPGEWKNADGTSYAGGFTYAWELNSSEVVAATRTITIADLDAQDKLGCVVTAGGNSTKSNPVTITG